MTEETQNYVTSMQEVDLNAGAYMLIMSLRCFVYIRAEAFWYKERCIYIFF